MASIGFVTGGKLAEYFTKEQLKYLYLGLGRGAFNYRYDNGQELVFSHMLLDQKLLGDIHRICFEIDLMVENQRGDNLFMQENELDMLKDCLKKYGVEVKPTCDAKYLEVGISSKSDNVDHILEYLQKEQKISASDCSFWGDKYVGIEEGIFGSDSFMKTKETEAEN